MKNGSLIAFLAFHLHVYSATITPQEQMACLRETEAAGTACHNAAHSASEQANQLSVQNGSRAGKDSLNQAADREAATTKKIADLLKGALGTCQAQLSKCTSSCPGEYGALGEACKKDVGKYIDQLSQGQGENIAGRDGSLRTDVGSASSSQRGGSVASASAPAPGSAAAHGGGPGPLSYQDLGTRVQKPVAGVDPATSGDRKSQVQKPVADTEVGSANSTGAYSSGGSGSAQGSLGGAAVHLETPGDYHEVRRNLLRKTLQGQALESAILQYCETAGARDGECNRIRSENFCASPGTGECPSCRKKSVDTYSKTEMQNVCVAACARDPQYGPQLADRCRSVVQARSNERPGAAKFEIEDVYGPSIFSIVSQTIKKRCSEGKLRCGI